MPELLRPSSDAGRGQVRLVVFVEDKAQEPVVFGGPGRVEGVAVRGPGADEDCTLPAELVGEKEDGIGEGVGVAVLVAEAKDGGAFAREVEARRTLRARLPSRAGAGRGARSGCRGPGSRSRAFRPGNNRRYQKARRLPRPQARPRRRAGSSVRRRRRRYGRRCCRKKCRCGARANYPRDFISLSSMSRAALLSPAMLRRSIISPALASSSTCSSINHWRKTWLA